MDNPTPHELVCEYSLLKESLSSLENLVKVNPRMLANVIELAMSMGVFVAEERLYQDYKRLQNLGDKMLKPFEYNPPVTSFKFRW